MRTRFRHSFALLSIIIVIPLACDITDGPRDVFVTSADITNLEVTPSSIQFTEADGIKDTLITFQINAASKALMEHRLVAVLASAKDRTVLASDTLQRAHDRNSKSVQSNQEYSGSFSGSLALEMSTNRFENLVLYLFPIGSEGVVGERIETAIPVRGIKTGYPEILDIVHPQSVVIPMPSEPDNRFFIAAKVSHTISLEYIRQVRLELYNSQNERIFASNMADNQPDYGTVPGDSIFVQNFSINSGNTPATYRIDVHAIDIAGTASDTLSSSLIITR